MALSLVQELTRVNVLASELLESTLSLFLICTFILMVILIILVICLFLTWILLKLTCQFLPRGSRDKLHVAFFHPYCNAGGGGERVLWSAVRALQHKYPKIECYVYTGDTEATAEMILRKAQSRFDISLKRSPKFIYLHTRPLVEAKYYPVFTLFLQSLGSIFLGFEALGKFKPDVVVDTMGYAFIYPIFRFLGNCPVISYTHYPTISMDMLQLVQNRTEAHNNRQFIANSMLFSFGKLIYYHIFAFVYGLVGRCADVVFVNSSWTHGHINQIWNCSWKTYTVFPPCNTKKFLELPIVPKENKKIKSIISIGQFRPEKNYPLQITSFHRLLQLLTNEQKALVELVLIGGCRNNEDEERVSKLKSLVSGLGIEQKVRWILNATFESLLYEVQNGTIGLHTMWNEHFGICVVECMAGGLIMLAHDSGGPKLDIVKPLNGKTTGYLAYDVESYAKSMKNILELSPQIRSEIRAAARESVNKFSDDVFDSEFVTVTRQIFEPLLVRI